MVLPPASCKALQFDVSVCELDLDIVLIEAEVPVLLAPELGMPVHVIDGQALANAGIMSNFLSGILDVAGLLLLAEEVLIGNAQVFDGLLRDVIRYIQEPLVFLRMAQDRECFAKLTVRLDFASSTEVIHLLVQCPIVSISCSTSKLE